MQLTDIASLEKWVELENHIHEKSGIKSNVFDVNGITITDNKKWVNKLCPEIKATDKGQSFICATAHMNLAIQARNTKKTVIGECDAGLLKMVVPIFYKDEFVGTFGTCGVLLSDGEVDSFMVNKTTEIDEDKIVQLSDGLPCVSNEKVESLSKYIEKKLSEIIN